MGLRILIVLLCIFALIIGCSNENSSGPNPEPEPFVDRVVVESDSVQAQSKLSLDVVVENKTPLTGIVIPLGYSGQNFSIDSVSIVDSRFTASELSGLEIYPDENRIVFWYYPQGGEVIDSGSGIAFRIYLWVWGNAPTQDIVIDSATMKFSTKLGYCDLQYNYFVPDFKRGVVHVQSITETAYREEENTLLAR